MEYQLKHQEIQSHHHNLEIVLLAENLQRPANYGMLIRMAESLGTKEVTFISNHYAELTNKMKRSSRAAENNINIVFSTDAESIIQKYKTLSYSILGLELTSHSTSIIDYKLINKKLLLIVGNESLGLSSNLIKKVDSCIHLPMYGKNSSMNVVVASSLALWTLIHR